MFKQIDAVPNFPILENEINKYWSDISVVEKLKEQRVTSGASERIYYDGPITANGIPHYGHAITWTMKDVIPRYWSMKGHLVFRNMGWDCQGIPVEYEVEKDLKFEKKEDIEAFGIEKFNDLCRQSVLKYRAHMFDAETKLGRWFDETQSYSTMDAKYIESIWWSLKELFYKGFLYEGHKVVAYSTRAGTTLSTHEVNDGGYKEIEDTFVTVKFKLEPHAQEKLISKLGVLVSGPVYVLAWTTTPWTIPGNLLLAVGKNITYSLVEFDGAYYIVADERVETVFKDKSYNVLLNKITYTNLIGLEYQPPFKYFANKKMEGCFRIIDAPHTNTEDGTGVVHLAPYGAEDFEVFMNLGISLFDYLDETAHFTNLIPEYEGKFYKQANPIIVEDLQAKEVLYDTGKILHRMPMCWRTGTPLIFKPVKSWYVAVTKLKEKMASENQNINWIPEHLKDGNSGIWINNARDWALSRNRYWGTPLPVWVNDKTGDKIVIGSFEELERLSGVKLEDPHKPFVDQITWEDQKNGGTFRRVKDVIDVWYDSASMPFARFHYPFENKEKFQNSFPAEYISEGLDQVRLWFYVMHVLGVALFDQVPYQNVVTIGTMLNSEAKKMSKSKRNYKPMDEVFSDYGADVLRYFILTSPLVYGVDTIFSETYLSDARKEFFLPLWNSLKYFLTYAEMYNFQPSDLKSTNELDKWILARLKELKLTVDSNMDKYMILDAARAFQPFVSDLSTWYIRRSRDRIKEGDLEALNVLYTVLADLSKYLAPFLPFLSEKMFEVLNLRETTGQPSVHMDTWSEVSELTEEEEQILVSMKNTRDLVSLALSIRVSEGVKVRQPLSALGYYNKTGTEFTFVENLVLDEVNVKKVLKADTLDELGVAKVENETLGVSLDLNITSELKAEGDLRELIRKIQDARKEAKLKVSDKVAVTVPASAGHLVEKFQDVIKKTVLANSIEVSQAEELRVTVQE